MDVNDMLERSYEFLDSYRSLENEKEKLSLLRNLVADFAKQKSPSIPEFAEGLDWFNVSQPLAFKRLLKGKVVLLDFFTYCCINCLHILPDLHALEDTFSESDGFVILGVHSAKFDNEKDSGNIRNAILRYNITHPVVNDSEGTLWASLMVHCWPTLVLVGPNGELLLSLSGEGHRSLLQNLLPLVLDHYRENGSISDHAVGIKLEKDSLKPSPLFYPGKVALDKTGRRLAIADTSHHRILVTDTSGNVQECIGGTDPGHRDGPFNSALFDSPQGIVWKGNCLYVADTENHRIRKVDLDEQTVSSIAGTGIQGQDKEGGLPGNEQPISSPWDVALCASVDGEEDAVLLIAMAGTHQIWVYFLLDCEWTKGMKYPAGTCIRFAGSGNEENRNNAYARKASFAQPSGLALGSLIPGKKELFVADSESSSVRSISLLDGAVKSVVGGAADPMNLFAFGDVDGKGREAKLQHPLGVAVRTKADGSQSLLVADSYNHKIKEVDLVTKQSVTVVSGGLREPGGLCVDESGRWLYIADTNNHSVKVLDLESRHLSQLVITFPTATTRTKEVVPTNRSPPKSAILRRGPLVELNKSSVTCLQLNVSLANGLHLTEGARTQWTIYSQNDDDVSQLFSEETSFQGSFDEMDAQPKWLLKPSNNNQDTLPEAEITVEAKIFYCDDEGTCRVNVVAFIIPVKILPDSPESPDGDVGEISMCQLEYQVSIS